MGGFGNSPHKNTEPSWLIQGRGEEADKKTEDSEKG